MNSLNFTSLYNGQKQALIRKNYQKIYSHELAHKNAGGSLAGAIVIEKNSEGIPIGGHVAIKMPKIDNKNPQNTINQAETVIKSALAPSDPSSQDYKVAKEALSIKNSAETLQKKKKLDYYA